MPSDASDLIPQGGIQSPKEVMEKSVDQGIKAFDQALLGLFHDGRITGAETVRSTDSANNLKLKVELATTGVWVVAAAYR